MNLINTACKVSGREPQERDLILHRQMAHSPTSWVLGLFTCSQVGGVGG